MKQTNFNISNVYLDKQKRSAKGTTKTAQSYLHHECFTDTILNNHTVRLENTRIQSTKHVLNTVVTNKVALSAFNDKRYILDNGIHTLPYGHHAVRDQAFYQTIIEDPDWRQEDPLINTH